MLTSLTPVPHGVAEGEGGTAEGSDPSPALILSKCPHIQARQRASLLLSDAALMLASWLHLVLALWPALMRHVMAATGTVATAAGGG